ncbi:hypothetical protein Vadar_002704 [Vaccinium darrowii]|uniref:Uncharacterized protein n=1 Tax=Vaccinium darrowii TaxID=229202 RepID=A0ACB7XMP4_9ERIC|nr:hypothetical protein Vadar_002704 [Vaccinium darrowii]
MYKMKSDQTDFLILGEAVGYEVACPGNLVLVGDEATSKNVELESIELFFAYAKLLQYEETITIMLEDGIFGHKIQISLTREDMEYVCEMQELSLTCIMLYISYLYVAVKETNLDSRFLFVDPSIVSGKFKSGEFSKPPLFARRLRDAKAGQLVFVPYNIGFHWVLVVIDLSSAMVFYFDSISEKIDKTLQLVIDTYVIQLFMIF